MGPKRPVSPPFRNTASLQSLPAENNIRCCQWSAAPALQPCCKVHMGLPWGTLGMSLDDNPWPLPSVMHLHFCRIPPSFCSLLFWEDGWKLDESHTSILRLQFEWNLFVLRHALRTLQTKKCLLSTIGVVIQKSGKSKRESSLLIIRSITWDRSFETTTHIRTFHLVFTFLAVFQYMSTKNICHIYLINMWYLRIPMFHSPFVVAQIILRSSPSSGRVASRRRVTNTEAGWPATALKSIRLQKKNGFFITPIIYQCYTMFHIRD